MPLDEDIVNRLKESNGSLSNFNGLLYGILFVTFIMVTLISFNIYFEFRHHLCAFSNVRKCVAGDKFCASKKTIQSDKNFAVEYLTNQSISINLDLNNVTNQTLDINYYYFNTATENISGTSIFSLDFNFTDIVPSTGVSDILSLGSSAGYHVNTNGVSIYLYPFSGKTITGVSASQIEYIISQGMSASSDVAYIFEPLEGTVNGNPPNSGIVFISDSIDYQFQVGTFILEKYVNSNPRNLGVTSSVTGTSSLFNNFSKNNFIPYEETLSDLETFNITEIIKLNNYKSRQNCNDKNKTGCNCIEPGLENIPDCKKYSYNQETGDYTALVSKNFSNENKVRFCSYLSSGSGSADSKSAVQINVPNAYSQVIDKNSNNASYYKYGYDPNNPVKDVDTFKNERYELRSIFCSDTSSLTNYDPENDNKLYTPNPGNVGNSNIGTCVWNSKQPNGQIVGNTVNLGHPFR